MRIIEERRSLPNGHDLSAARCLYLAVVIALPEILEGSVGNRAFWVEADNDGPIAVILDHGMFVVEGFEYGIAGLSHGAGNLPSGIIQSPSPLVADAVCNLEVWVGDDRQYDLGRYAKSMKTAYGMEQPSRPGIILTLGPFRVATQFDDHLQLSRYIPLVKVGQRDTRRWGECYGIVVHLFLRRGGRGNAQRRRQRVRGYKSALLERQHDPDQLRCGGAAMLFDLLPIRPVERASQSPDV